MLKPFGDYDKVKGYGDGQRLPKGGYVLTIMGVDVLQNSNGTYLKIGCDIAEGDYNGFFIQDWKNQQTEDRKWHCNYLLNIPKDDGTEQDGWTKRRFKTFTEALEDSNEGYRFDWNEQLFKGKHIGGLFNEREYEARDGSIKRAVNLAQVCTVEKIRSGNYTLPDDKLLNRESAPASAAPPLDGFMSVSGAELDELPFA